MNSLFRINTLLTAFAIAFVISLVPSSSNAQGRYSNTYSKQQVRGYIDRLVRSSNTFRRDFDSYMDRSSLNGTPTEDQYNRTVRNYENAMDRLQRQFNGFGTWWDNRTNVQSMLDQAQPVNEMINQLPFARNIERQWRAMRDDINKVADTFDLPGLDGGGWNGGGWNGGGAGGGGWNGGGGGQTSTPPTWAQGTFKWMGSDPRLMTIDRTGRVSVTALGRTTYGTFYRNVISINGETLKITRTNNGIQLYNPRDGGTADWRVATNENWNPGIGDIGGGNMSAPPSWARGTFSWVGSDPRQMTIDRNGRVTLTALGNTTSGTYYRDVITINGENLNVSRTSNGIRLYNPRDGGTSDWRR